VSSDVLNTTKEKLMIALPYIQSTNISPAGFSLASSFSRHYLLFPKERRYFTVILLDTFSGSGTWLVSDK
jgi:hypothetical protein